VTAGVGSVPVLRTTAAKTTGVPATGCGDHDTETRTRSAPADSTSGVATGSDVVGAAVVGSGAAGGGGIVEDGGAPVGLGVGLGVGLTDTSAPAGGGAATVAVGAAVPPPACGSAGRPGDAATRSPSVPVDPSAAVHISGTSTGTVASSTTTSPSSSWVRVGRSRCTTSSAGGQ
jgi:hypothetical protein